MVIDEDGPVPELARRITVCSSAHDPAATLAAVLQDMAAAGDSRQAGTGKRSPDSSWVTSSADLAHQLPRCTARSCCHGAAIQREGPTAVSGDQASDL